MSRFQSRWVCSVPGCGFLAQSKVGLVNHTRKKHTTTAQCQLRSVYPPSNVSRHNLKHGHAMKVLHKQFCEIEMSDVCDSVRLMFCVSLLE